MSRGTISEDSSPCRAQHLTCLPYVLLQGYMNFKRERGTHEPQVRPLRQDVPQHDEQKVLIPAALVNFVHHDVGHVGQRRVADLQIDGGERIRKKKVV